MTRIPSPWKLSPSTTTIPRTSYIHGNWRGLYEGWSHRSRAGGYSSRACPQATTPLRIRAVSNEEKYKVYEERSLGLSVARPLWAGTWAIAGYASLCVLAGVVSFRVAMLRRQKKDIRRKDVLLHTYCP